MWKGLKEINKYKTPSPSPVENQQQADDLDEFYCRFEKTEQWRWSCTSGETPLLSPHSPSWESFRFLGTTVSQDLKRDNHIESIVKKAQQRLFFLHQLRKFNLSQELLKQFFSAIIKYILCTSITDWYNSTIKSELRRLRRVVRTAERIIGTTLPSL